MSKRLGRRVLQKMSTPVSTTQNGSKTQWVGEKRTIYTMYCNKNVTELEEIAGGIASQWKMSCMKQLVSLISLKKLLKTPTISI